MHKLLLPTWFQAAKANKFVTIQQLVRYCANSYNQSGLSAIHIAAYNNAKDTVDYLLPFELNNLTQQVFEFRAANVRNAMFRLPRNSHTFTIALLQGNRRICYRIIEAVTEHQAQSMILGMFPSAQRTFRLLLSVDNDFRLATQDVFIEPEIMGNFMSVDNAAILACQCRREDILDKLLEKSRNPKFTQNVYKMFLTEDARGRRPLELLDVHDPMYATTWAMTQEAESYFNQKSTSQQSYDALAHYCCSTSDMASTSDVQAMKQLWVHGRSASFLRINDYCTLEATDEFQ